MVGDGCMVTLLDENDMLQNAANAHRDPALEADYRAYLASMTVSKVASASVSASVARTGQPVREEISPDAMIARADENLRPLVAGLNVHAFAVVPIRAREMVIGTLSLVRSGLRAPLRTIAGFAQALAEDCGDLLTPQCVQHLARVRAAAGQMGQLIDALLELSRVTRADLRRVRAGVSELAHAVVARLREASPDRQIEVPIEPNLVADTDPHLVRVVLTNCSETRGSSRRSAIGLGPSSG